MVKDVLHRALGSPLHVALKVQKSASHYTDAALDEIDLLLHAGRAGGNERVVKLLDHFEHDGPNGRHVCMIFEMLGANLLSVIRKSEYRGLPISTVRNLARQICEGLDFLHRECSIIHTDLKPENVLLKRPRRLLPVATVVSRRASIESKIDELCKNLDDAVGKKDRKRIKNKLKKQRQKARKVVVEDVLVSVAGRKVRAPPSLFLKTNFEEEEEEEDEEEEDEEEEGNEDDEDSLFREDGDAGSDDALSVVLVSPWQRVYEALGPYHEERPPRLELATWRYADFSVEGRGSPSSKNEVDSFVPLSGSTWLVRIRAGGPLLRVLAALERRLPGLVFVDTTNDDRLAALAAEHDAALLGLDFFSTASCESSSSKQRSWKPKPLSRRIRIASTDAYCDEEARIDDVKIVDLGNACWRHKHFTEDIQTRQYRSPEVIVGADYDTSADVWSLACVIFELLTGDLLFDPRAGVDYDRDEDHLAQMQELLGRYPKSLASKARRFFNRRGELKHIQNLNFWDLKSVLVKKYNYAQPRAEAISDFLAPMLDFYPQRRATALECLNHPFLSISSSLDDDDHDDDRPRCAGAEPSTTNLDPPARSSDSPRSV
ncbi:hypothetical protein CTAYLR_004642 [Chrysophaeum taylorii]|uniref:non-specific serine/threonine protein kinase n=1 Tax=Chrysophaeum taylorii TaxID=2483200 RepID=A0AAD7XS00_9STRA|nr:hypothetical protein CTAYLR_004642 [Chrysophaeum taylorii]